MVDYKTVTNNKNKGGNAIVKPKWKGVRSTVGSNFKGAIAELNSHVFVTGPNQANKYDDAYKHRLHYFGNKFNHRVYQAFECKDETVGLDLHNKPSAPMTTKIVQEATPGADSKMIGVKRLLIDKESEDYLEYQVELKQYVTDKTKYRDDIHKCFNIIMGQYSPAVEQNLEAEEVFEDLKSKSNSIKLIKLLEKLCYSYRAHKYTLLGAWNAFDKLGNLTQPDDVHEVKYYDAFRSVVEMCKASNINFVLTCTANIGMVMKELEKNSKIKKSGTFDDGTYFKLNDAERALVNKMAEEMCLSTRFLSLSSDLIHSGSKQELVNDMVKGEDKYLRTMASTLRFL